MAILDVQIPSGCMCPYKTTHCDSCRLERWVLGVSLWSGLVGWVLLGEKG